MRNLIIVYTLFFFILSCGTNKSEFKKKIDFDVFEIEVPKTWEKLNIQGMDSYVGGIKTKNGDSVYFDYGKDTYKMDNVLKVNNIKEFKELDSIGFDVEELIFSKHPNIDQNQGTFHDEYYFYDTVDNYNVKFSIPKKPGMGITAVLFDNLPNNNTLYIYARNINKVEQDKLIEAYNTIKIK